MFSNNNRINTTATDAVQAEVAITSRPRCSRRPIYIARIEKQAQRDDRGHLSFTDAPAMAAASLRPPSSEANTSLATQGVRDATRQALGKEHPRALKRCLEPSTCSICCLSTFMEKLAPNLGVLVELFHFQPRRTNSVPFIHSNPSTCLRLLLRPLDLLCCVAPTTCSSIGIVHLCIAIYRII